MNFVPLNLDARRTPLAQSTKRLVKLRGCLAMLAPLSWLLVCAAPVHSETIDIGSRRELFVDDLLIGQLKNARRVLHRPQRREKALVFDQPWEGGFSGYTTG